MTHLGWGQVRAVVVLLGSAYYTRYSFNEIKSLPVWRHNTKVNKADDPSCNRLTNGRLEPTY